MYLGIDIGTSSVKSLLLDENGVLIASKSEDLPISRPHPMWSEQDPADWWKAVDKTVRRLGSEINLGDIKAIGLSGQMHGATLLDRQQRILRPAILWNDGRSHLQCQTLERLVPNARHITGNIMMPGFTAPKLLWVRENEQTIFRDIDKVLLPKDYIRLMLTGEFATDMSDAAGTMWMDVAARNWNDELLDACGLSRVHMPTLYEGNQITGLLRKQVALAWGMSCVPVVAGGGDNAAGAVGVGIYRAGQAMLSLGTSGVYFTVTDGFRSNPDRAVHSFCHALPKTWHLMSVMLSAASCLDWLGKLTKVADVTVLLDEAEHDVQEGTLPWFLPYLSGERTPYNDPYAKGVFFGLTHQHGRAELVRAVLEGVGFGLLDGIDAVSECGTEVKQTTLIGGGARSVFWRQMLADISGRVLEYRRGGESGPALGAARLAQIALNPSLDIAIQLPPPPLEQVHHPDRARHAQYTERRATFKELYRQLHGLMRSP
ncbi:xylulokinase [Acidithiobacillus sp. M4-SHS-6]|uniref:xylulokinase n=1 Tax=Acidithiobacillus sp. M4-SHS-6 TaxID=3383024 RepID=UPI0039BDC522